MEEYGTVKSILEMSEGKIMEAVDLEVKKVIQNLADPDTPVKMARKVTIELTFASEDMSRKRIAVTAAVKSKLAPSQNPATELYVLSAAEVIEVGARREYADGGKMPVQLRMEL